MTGGRALKHDVFKSRKRQLSSPPLRQGRDFGRPLRGNDRRGRAGRRRPDEAEPCPSESGRRMARAAIEPNLFSICVLGFAPRASVPVRRSRVRACLAVALSPERLAHVGEHLAVAPNPAGALQVEVKHLMLHSGDKLFVPTEMIVIGDGDGQGSVRRAVLDGARARFHPAAEAEVGCGEGVAEQLPVQSVEKPAEELKPGGVRPLFSGR